LKPTAWPTAALMAWTAFGGTEQTDIGGWVHATRLAPMMGLLFWKRTVCVLIVIKHSTT
jgi:hypothetical protein